jgi:hypothetical protein
MWLTALPLLLIPACWLMFMASLHHPGMVLGRGSGWVLVLGCVLAAVVALSPASRTRTPAWSMREAVRSPVFWACLAITWQLLVYALRAPVWMPGLPWALERTCALGCAWGLAEYLAGCRLPRAVWGLCGAGAVLLLISAGSILSPGLSADPTLPGFELPSLWHAPSWFGLGLEAPFGLSNFNVAAGMPLMGMAACLWWRERQGWPPWWLHTLLVLGCLALLPVALRAHPDAQGLHLSLPISLDAHGTLRLSLGEGVRGAYVELAAMLGVLLCSLLPWRWQLPGILLGVVVLLGGEALCASGAVATASLSPSSLQRVELWRCAGEAASQAPLCGYGVGSAVAVLNEQPAFPLAWMAVPSFPEHAHQELLETLLDGGIVNLVLVAMVLLTTLEPLWRGRAQGACLALLVAWAGVLSHAMLEVSLSQSGPVLMLAVLAGVSWAYVAGLAPEATAAPAAAAVDPRAPAHAVRPGAGQAAAVHATQAIACLGAAAALATFMVGEMRGHLGTLQVGSVPELQARCEIAFKQAQHHGDNDEIRRVVEQLVHAVGPLDILPYQLAHCELRRGLTHLQDSVELALEQARMLPVFAENLRFLEHLRLDCERHHQPWNAQRIAAALEIARDAGMRCLREVPENAKNQVFRHQLEVYLRQPPPAMAAPSPPDSPASTSAAPGG